jgi:hypothetical protein
MKPTGGSGEKFVWSPFFDPSTRKTTPPAATPPPPPAPPAEKAKAPRTKKLTLDEKIRKEAWAIHYGPNQKSAICPCCGIREMESRVFSGWHTGHIVPADFCEDATSAYYLVPICSHCNGTMGQQNLFDFLWENFKIESLKIIATNVYTAFSQRNAEQMHLYNHCLWKLIQFLYGHDRHPLGGGITCANEEAIYKTLMMHQMRMLEETISSLMTDVKAKSAQLELLVKDVFKPSKRARHFA